MNTLIGNTTATIMDLDKATALANLLGVEALEAGETELYKVEAKFGKFAVSVYHADGEFILTL